MKEQTCETVDICPGNLNAKTNIKGSSIVWDEEEGEELLKEDEDVDLGVEEDEI